jgi:hypothetical protein
MYLLSILSFVFSGEFIVGAIAGSIITLVVINNISKKEKDAAQGLLDQANTKIKDLESKIGLKK